MNKITIIIALTMLSLTSFAQLDGDFVEGMVHNPNKYLGQQQKEISNTIESEIKAQIRQQQKQAAKQQAIENYNNKMHTDGQNRMEYYNNPDNYINRDITNRGSSYTTNEPRSSNPQTRDLRTEPIHSENLNSKSLQMLREANKGLFSNEDREITINPNARVQLFDAPSLEYKPYLDKPDRVKRLFNERARKEAERKALENKVAHNNGIIDLIKDGTGLVLGATMKSGVALVSANLNLYAELVKYANECSAGTKKTKEYNDFERFLKIDKALNWLGPELTDSYEIITNASYKTAVDVLAPWVGDKMGVAYVGMEKVGTYSWDMFNSMQIGFSISDYAVSYEKQEE